MSGRWTENSILSASRTEQVRKITRRCLLPCHRAAPPLNCSSINKIHDNGRRLSAGRWEIGPIAVQTRRRLRFGSKLGGFVRSRGHLLLILHSGCFRQRYETTRVRYQFNGPHRLIISRSFSLLFQSKISRRIFFFFHNGKQFLLENLIGGCFVFFFMLYLFFSLKLHVTDLANCSPAEPCRFNLAANEISTFRLFHRRDTPTRSDPTVSVFLSISLELGTSFFFFFFFFCQRT